MSFYLKNTYILWIYMVYIHFKTHFCGPSEKDNNSMINLCYIRVHITNNLLHYCCVHRVFHLYFSMLIYYAFDLQCWWISVVIYSEGKWHNRCLSTLSSLERPWLLLSPGRRKCTCLFAWWKYCAGNIIKSEDAKVLYHILIPDVSILFQS